MCVVFFQGTWKIGVAIVKPYKRMVLSYSKNLQCIYIYIFNVGIYKYIHVYMHIHIFHSLISSAKDVPSRAASSHTPAFVTYWAYGGGGLDPESTVGFLPSEWWSYFWYQGEQFDSLPQWYLVYNGAKYGVFVAKRVVKIVNVKSATCCRPIGQERT